MLLEKFNHTVVVVVVDMWMERSDIHISTTFGSMHRGQGEGDRFGHHQQPHGYGPPGRQEPSGHAAGGAAGNLSQSRDLRLVGEGG